MRLELEKLNNTRDLGGLRTRDGRTVLAGRLIRSGHLFPASEADRIRLSGLAELIVDFRSDREKTEHPDPDISGAAYLHLPVFNSLAAGVSRDAKSDEAAFAMVSREPQAARNYMIRTYESFVSESFARQTYARFVRILLEKHEKAVLWHCTAGKDRTGFATVILLELLGVDREEILKDYLRTNEYLKEEQEQLIHMVQAQSGIRDEASREALTLLFGASEIFLNALYQKTESLFGSFEGFLEQGLDITPDKKKKLQEMYLL